MTCENGEDDVFFELMHTARTIFNRNDLPHTPQDYACYYVFIKRPEFSGKNLLQAVNTIPGVYERAKEILETNLQTELSGVSQCQKLQAIIRRP